MDIKENTVIRIHEHGYVKVIKFWGDEQEIISSARMSTGGTFKGWGKDLGLLQYLYEHRHDTPFEFVGATFEIKAPIFVFREWHRHRTMSYNEASARYIPLPDEKYVPTRERVLRGIEEAGANKQAGSHNDHKLTDHELTTWLKLVNDSHNLSQIAYEYGIDKGVPKELARITMPVSQYSTMRVNTNLRNWLGFLTLRQASNAQEEIRVYADSVANCLEIPFRNTMGLYHK